MLLCIHLLLPFALFTLTSTLFRLHLHLADAFNQSNLQCIQAIHFLISMCVPWELNPRPFSLLTQCSTTEPQEHQTNTIRYNNNFSYIYYNIDTFNTLQFEMTGCFQLIYFFKCHQLNCSSNYFKYSELSYKLHHNAQCFHLTCILRCSSS